MRRRLLVVLCALSLSASAACKRKKPPPPVDDDEPEVAQDAGPPPAPPPAKAKAPAPVPKPASSYRLTDGYLVRADTAVKGYPMPKGTRRLSSTKTTEVHEAPFTLRSIERFYRREMPKAKLEKRTFGFRVVEEERNGFVLVTQPKGAPTPNVAVISPRRPPKGGRPEQPPGH